MRPSNLYQLTPARRRPAGGAGRKAACGCSLYRLDTSARPAALRKGFGIDVRLLALSGLAIAALIATVAWLAHANATRAHPPARLAAPRTTPAPPPAPAPRARARRSDRPPEFEQAAEPALLTAPPLRKATKSAQD